MEGRPGVAFVNKQTQKARLLPLTGEGSLFPNLTACSKSRCSTVKALSVQSYV
ncbi:hypothetical protein MM300_02730 [Evansella sp. LMS18]|uniref:hypothetical protein n=1 Tax=Evansella sp. LMS18 TaxID=2924033 RepID=UPI0020D01069|nr:hypothetical protein [Evansella sp. LMS18]UTR11266.1 hypothetical protein MM300_02730 [Evansella sp. LMS18]